VTESQHVPKPRSRRMYILWAIALTLLISTGLFCWLVVVPVWRTRRVVMEYATDYADEIAEGDSCRDRLEAVRILGGPVPAARELRRYLLLPEVVAGHKIEAASILPFCGIDARDAVLDVLSGGSYESQWAVVYNLERVSRVVAPPKPCAELVGDAEVLAAIAKAMRQWPGTGLDQYGAMIIKRQASEDRQAAAEALKKIKAKQEKK
jgi:hypothetical protein